MNDYDPAVDGIGLEQLNIELQDKLNECFKHLEDQGTEENLKQEISILKAQVNLLVRIVHGMIYDYVRDQDDIDRLNYIRSSQNN